MSPISVPISGARRIAQTLHGLGIKHLFGLVGIPVVDIAEECIDLGIKFIAFRNEQSCAYAASAYGYMTGRPGVCLVVGGPGVLHAIAGIGNASANAFPFLLLAGSAESHLVTKGAFQELDAISLLTPHTKKAIRPRDVGAVSDAITTAYRAAWYGRPGPAFVDLPADVIQGQTEEDGGEQTPITPVPYPPRSRPDDEAIVDAIKALMAAKAPLIVVGKGAAYARAEESIRELVDRTQIPFLPTPMGKGVVQDSHPLNASSARSVALKNADCVLLLGARLNWILHFGEAPKWDPSVKFIHVDIAAEEIGLNCSSSLGLHGDIASTVKELLRRIPQNFKYNPSAEQFDKSHNLSSQKKAYTTLLAESASKNEQSASMKALAETKSGSPLTYQRTFHLIKEKLHQLSPPENGDVVYVSEGANTMDISRSIFNVEHPRQRLDAGTYATMGVGLGYVIAAHAAYNMDPQISSSQRKKIVALEGDSAFGFSGMEIETMARYQIPAIVYVMNNSGVYHGDAVNVDNWKVLQEQTVKGDAPSSRKEGLRSTTLLYETRYDHMATMCGEGNARGFFVRTEEELVKATAEAYAETGRVSIINVMIEPGIGKTIGFKWQESGKKEKKLKGKL